MARNLSFRQDVLSLCRKVQEVIFNNDWPTEEGQMNEGGECDLLDLVIAIQHELE